MELYIYKTYTYSLVETVKLTLFAHAFLFFFRIRAGSCLVLIRGGGRVCFRQVILIHWPLWPTESASPKEG